MKIYSAFFLTSLILLMGMGFSACSEKETVVPKTVEDYKNELNNLVSSDKAAVENCVVGYNKGDFKVAVESDFDTVVNRYMDSLLLAEEIMANPNVTIDELVYANWAITVPGDEYWNRVFISDRRPLQEEIVYSDTLRANTPVGTEPGQAPFEADSIFGVAISGAKYWRNLVSTIDRQVASETDSLYQQRLIYEDAIIK